MGDKATIEFSTFGIPNPIRNSPLHVDSFVDRYLVLTPEYTLKRRVDRTVKFKEKTGEDDGLDWFHVQVFADTPDHDPLASFLRLHDWTRAYSEGGIMIPKTRSFYQINGISVHFTQFSLQGAQHTHLAITGRNPARVRKLVDLLGIKENNLSFGEYLTGICGHS